MAEFCRHILPIEVKAGKAGALKSLHQFVAERQAPVAVRFDANPPALQRVQAEVRRRSGVKQVNYQLLSLPLYLVERLPQIIAGLVPLVRRGNEIDRRRRKLNSPCSLWCQKQRSLASINNVPVSIST